LYAKRDIYARETSQRELLRFYKYQRTIAQS